MCGRFALHTPRSRIASRYFNLQFPVGDIHSSYNITPGIQITTVHATSDEPVSFGFSHWGFHPPWAKEDAPTPINIRAEKAATSPYFRSAFAHRRCLIPANGWYEWRKTESGKQPYYITLRNPEPNDVLFLAGLWEPTGEGTETCCAILTEPVSPAFAFIHDRQPVVLDPECRWQWLDPGLSDRDKIRKVARRLDPDRLIAYPVSTRVNRPANDDPSLIKESPGMESAPIFAYSCRAPSGG
jgi:putative SOS response-associated peptidase YedK